MTKVNKMPPEPSKATMAREDRRWRAEGMVKDAMCQTPQFKTAVKAAEKQLAKVETVVKSAVKKGK